MTVHVNIGSNLGSSREMVEKAAAAIERRFGVVARRAPIEESEPWGYSSSHSYVNLGIAFDSTLAPGELLRELLSIEREISPEPHRHTDGSYADRLIDIDLIAVGQAIVSTPELTLPHPRMHLRPFVLRPMALLDPEWIHPLFHLTPARLLTMESKISLARELKSTYNCAQAVAVAYAPEVGLDPTLATKICGAFCAGFGNYEGTCGAIAGAGIIIGMATDGDRAKGRRAMTRIMERFAARNGSVKCRDLKGIDTGYLLRKCPDCVADAAEFLESELSEINQQ